MATFSLICSQKKFVTGFGKTQVAYSCIVKLSTVHIVISIVWQKFIDNDVHNIYEIKSPKR